MAHLVFDFQILQHIHFFPIMISRRTCLLAALALSTVEGFAPQPNVKSVTKLNNDIAPTGEFFSSGCCSSHLISQEWKQIQSRIGSVEWYGARWVLCHFDSSAEQRQEIQA